MKRTTIVWIAIHIVVVLVILGLAFAPLASVAVAGGIANANGCQLDEGSAHPCVVNGQDLGETLYTLGVMGWLMLVTVPLGLGAAGLYLLVVAVVVLVRKRREQRNENREP